MTVGKNITEKKREKGSYQLSFNIEAVGKNIKWEEGEGDGNFEEENLLVIIYPKCHNVCEPAIIQARVR